MISLSNVSIVQTQENNALTVSLGFSLTDSQFTYVTATVNWGDGTSWTSGRMVRPINPSLSHTYGPGQFTIRVTVQNFRLPLPDQAEWSTDVQYYQTVSGKPPALPQSVGYSYIGPTLPDGRNWDWDIATDNILVDDALELLLATSAGEKLMDYNYGANLVPLVFSPNDGVLADMLRTDISQAVATYEPRAQLQQMSLQQAETTATVNVVFNSLIAPGQIPLAVTFPS